MKKEDGSNLEFSSKSDKSIRFTVNFKFEISRLFIIEVIKVYRGKVASW